MTPFIAMFFSPSSYGCLVRRSKLNVIRVCVESFVLRLRSPSMTLIHNFFMTLQANLSTMSVGLSNLVVSKPLPSSIQCRSIKCWEGWWLRCNAHINETNTKRLNPRFVMARMNDVPSLFMIPKLSSGLSNSRRQSTNLFTQPPTVNYCTKDFLVWYQLGPVMTSSCNQAAK